MIHPASRRHLAYAQAVQDAYTATLAAEAVASCDLDGDTYTLPGTPPGTPQDGLSRPRPVGDVREDTQDGGGVSGGSLWNDPPWRGQ